MLEVKVAGENFIGGSPLLNFIRMYLRRKKEPLQLLRRLAPTDLKLETLVHVGAHLAQERHLYEKCGFKSVLWIEGSPEVYARLSKVLEQHNGAAEHEARCALLTERDGDEVSLLAFSNDGLSSSIFSPTSELRKRWPHVDVTGAAESVVSRTLDTLLSGTAFANRCDVLVVDVQGAELLVLKGAESTIAMANAVIVEISTRPFYDGGVLYPELKAFLESRGFTAMAAPCRHGDMLFLRNEHLQKSKAA